MEPSPEVRLLYIQATAEARRTGRRPRFLRPFSGKQIIVTMWQLPDSTTADNSSKFHAEAEVDGQRFEAQSRRGASCVLARRMKEAGIPDQPLSVRDTEGREMFRWPSLYRAAEVTFGESAKTPLRMGKFVDLADRISVEE